MEHVASKTASEQEKVAQGDVATAASTERPRHPSESRSDPSLHKYRTTDVNGWHVCGTMSYE